MKKKSLNLLSIIVFCIAIIMFIPKIQDFILMLAQNFIGRELRLPSKWKSLIDKTGTLLSLSSILLFLLSMEKKNYSCEKHDWKYISFIFPLIELFLFFAIGTYSLLLKISISWMTFIIAYLIGIFIIMKLSNDSIKSFILSSCILFFSIASMIIIYDRSWDGNAYHKLCTGLIKEGWNPVWETIDAAIEKFNYFPENTAKSPFYDGYPKASYIISAVVYAFSNNIEYGKVYTLLAWFTAIASIIFTCQNIFKLSFTKSICISTAICCTPVTLGQMFTFYNDGFLHLLVFIVISEFIVLYNSKPDFSIHHFIIVISIILGANLKYSALILLFIPCLIYLLFIIKNQKERFIKVLFFYSLIIVLSIIIFGLTSYIHNIAFHKNPFYTMIGKDKVDVLSPSIPYVYRKIHPFFRLILSIFSPVSNNHLEENIILKFPFTIYKDNFGEIYSGFDTRFAGWGVFYSGLFLIAVIIFIFRLTKYKLDILNKSFVIISIFTFSPALVLTTLNNARYWPYPFIFPAWSLLCLFSSTKTNKKVLIGGFVLYLLIFLNSAGQLKGMVYSYKHNIAVRKEYMELKNYSEKNKQNLCFDFPGLLYNLHDHNIYINQKYKDNDAFRVVNNYNCGSIYMREE